MKNNSDSGALCTCFVSYAYVYVRSVSESVCVLMRERMTNQIELAVFRQQRDTIQLLVFSHVALLEYHKHILCRLGAQKFEVVENHHKLIADFELRRIIAADCQEVRIELALERATHETTIAQLEDNNAHT